VKQLRSFVFVFGILVIVAVPISGLLAWSELSSGWPFSGTYNAYSAQVDSTYNWGYEVLSWRLGVPPGYLMLGVAALSGLFLALAFRKPITDPRVRYCGLAIGTMGAVNLALVVLNSSPWSSQESPNASLFSSYNTNRTTWSEAADVQIGLYASLFCCLLQIGFGICVGLGVRYKSEDVVEPMLSVAKEPRMQEAKGYGDETSLREPSFESSLAGSINRSESVAEAETVTPTKSLGLGVNAVLFIAIPLLGLFPFVSLGALGFSASVNSFRMDDGEAQRFWLTVVPVGWVVVAVSVVALVAIAIAAMKSSQSANRSQNQLLAGLSVIIGAVIIASWFYANRAIDDANSEAASQLAAEGNPFAEMLGVGVSLSPALGFWLILAVALAIAGFNVFLIREAGKPTSSVAVIPNTTLADGIRELSELRDQGMISEEEFTLAKRKLLGE
jgi:hypothetical protein